MDFAVPKKTLRGFFLQGSARAVEPRDDRDAVETLANPHRRFDAFADANLFPALDYDRRHLLGKRRWIEGRKVMFLAGLQLLSGDVRFEGGEKVRRLGERDFARCDMAAGIHC